MLLFKIKLIDFIEIIKLHCFAKKVSLEKKIINDIEIKHLEEEFENYEKRFPYF